MTQQEEKKILDRCYHRARASGSPALAYAIIEAKRCGLELTGQQLSMLRDRLSRPSQDPSPSPCRACFWAGTCNTLETKHLDPECNCRHFLHRNTPRWAMAIKATVCEKSASYDAGVLETSTPDGRSVSISGKDQLLAAIKDMTTKAPTSSLTIRRFTPGWTTLLVKRIRPDRNESYPEYLERAERVLNRVAEIIGEERSDTSDESIENSVRTIINNIGHHSLLTNAYAGDVHWFCRDFWPGMLMQDVVLQYSNPSTNGVDKRERELTLQLLKGVIQ